MGNYISPLVDVKEFDTTTTIPSVATSIGVLILRDTYKGPEMKKQFISSVDELISVFGKPTSNVQCYQDMMSAVGFLKYSNMLYCTRATASAATYAGAVVTVGGEEGDYTGLRLDEIQTALATDGGDIDDFGNYSMSGDFLTIISKSRGVCGNNIRVAIAGKDKVEACSVLYDSGVWDQTLNIYSPSASFGSADVHITKDNEFLVVVQTVNQGESATLPSVYSDDNNWVTREVFHVSTDPNAYDDTGRKRYVETLINETSDYIRVAINTPTYDASSDMSTMLTESWISLEQGTDYYSNTALHAEDTAIINALRLYDNPEDVDVNIFIESNKSNAVKRSMVAICESRKDAIAILDVELADVVGNKNNETSDLRDYVTSDINDLNTSYACIYGNWLEVYDKWNGKYRWVPASGYVAGLFANNDSVADTWFAPAGPNRALLSGVRRLGWNPSLGQRNILYKNNINPIVSLSGMGKLIYGQKTLLKKDSDFNRINIRRLFITLEKAISTASKYFLFEPNDDISRLLLINMINPFLRDVKSRRGIYDYKVVCNETNNTPERIDRGELYCDIYIKATKATEFIVLNFIATKSGASFSELAGITG